MSGLSMPMPKALVATIAFELAGHEPFLGVVAGLAPRRPWYAGREPLGLQQPRHLLALLDRGHVDDPRCPPCRAASAAAAAACRFGAVWWTRMQVRPVDAEVDDRRLAQPELAADVARMLGGGRGQRQHRRAAQRRDRAPSRGRPGGNRAPIPRGSGPRRSRTGRSCRAQDGEERRVLEPLGCGEHEVHSTRPRSPPARGHVAPRRR